MTKDLGEEEVSFGNLNEKIIGQVVLAGVGIWTLLYYLPYLVTSIIFLFKDSIARSGSSALSEMPRLYATSSFTLVVYFTAIVLGFLVVRYNQWIAGKVFGFGELEEQQ